ncbi:MAG: Rnf-Nqr domain containing protein, partial [Christensenellales bacterium]
INVQDQLTLLETILNGFSAAVGFALAIILFAGIRERLETSNIPKSMQGFPIALISAGLMSMAFSGFASLQNLLN